MKNLWYKLKQRISVSYGDDSLNRFLLLTSLVFMILNLFLGFYPLWAMAVLLYVWYFFRFFSKNYTSRRRELAAYNGIKWRIKQKWGLLRRKFSERKTHKYFKCRRCSATLRVPKGKGSITGTCPKCGEKANKKT